MKRIGPGTRLKRAKKYFKYATLTVAAMLALAIVWDVASYDADAWLADYARLKRDMAQGYANLDWMADRRGVDLAALDRRTTDDLRNAHSNVRAFVALRGFVRGFGDPHLRMRPGERPAPTQRIGSASAVEEIDPPAGADCAAAGYEEGDHSFRFPFAKIPGWRQMRGGDFPSGTLGDTGVLRIAQFGEDQYLSACQAVFEPGIGRYTLKLAVRARQQAQLREAIAELRKHGARRLLVDVSGNGGGTEWVSEVVALTTDRELHRRGALRTGPACDRSAVWQGAPAPCPVFAETSVDRIALQGTGEWRGPLLILADRGTGSAAEDFVAWLQQNKIATVLGEKTAGAGCGYVDGGHPTRLSMAPVDVWMPNCARFLEDGTNEIEGIAPNIALPMADSDSDAQALALKVALARD